ncbi:hypothetical protein RHGRI_029523 [Rhododendron griersonianum]|uniref:Uncharacterized protein n=1 Tax=Rhododendron griersonianum TaxID=479676 RepID=A0AAV6IJS1_9ERIC|nr:hypothetical protein RHGRI_029523 [Rhododendron griersonianum]
MGQSIDLKRTKNVEIEIEEYNRMKEADPEFYKEVSSLQYGKSLSLISDYRQPYSEPSLKNGSYCEISLSYSGRHPEGLLSRVCLLELQQ